MSPCTLRNRYRFSIHAQPLARRLACCSWLVLGLLHCGGSDDGNGGTPSQAAASQTLTPPATAANGAGSNSTQAAASSSSSTSVPAAAQGDTWDSYAQGFFVEYCVSCHNDDQTGDASRDFHQRVVVDAESSEIACGLSKSTPDWSARGCTGFPPARQFPIGNGPKPSDTDRDRLISWIDAGRP